MLRCTRSSRRCCSSAGALKRDPGDLTVIAPMRKAVADYARQFDDPAAPQAK